MHVTNKSVSEESKKVSKTINIIKKNNKENTNISASSSDRGAQGSSEQYTLNRWAIMRHPMRDSASLEVASVHVHAQLFRISTTHVDPYTYLLYLVFFSTENRKIVIQDGALQL